MISIINAMEDPRLFGDQFVNPSWRPWKAFLRALFGLKMNGDEFKLYQQCTGRREQPREQSKECWLIAGRRSGKSFVMATVATYFAAFHSYQQFLKACLKSRVKLPHEAAAKVSNRLER